MRCSELGRSKEGWGKRRERKGESKGERVRCGGLIEGERKRRMDRGGVCEV